MKFDELLEKLELNGYEKKIYISLLKLQECNVQKLSIESKVPRGRIYDILNNLIAKGLITSLPSKPKKYKVNNPKKAIKNYLSDKKNSISETINEVENVNIPEIILKNEDKEDFEIIPTEKLYHEKIKEFKSTAKKEMFSLISGKKPPKYVGYETRQMLKRKVTDKIIVNEHQNYNYEKEKIKLGSLIKKYPIKGIRFIIKDKNEILASIINDESFKGITIYSTNKDFINSMLEFFNSIWKKAKKI